MDSACEKLWSLQRWLSQNTVQSDIRCHYPGRGFPTIQMNPDNLVHSFGMVILDKKCRRSEWLIRRSPHTDKEFSSSPMNWTTQGLRPNSIFYTLFFFKMLLQVFNQEYGSQRWRHPLKTLTLHDIGSGYIFFHIKSICQYWTKTKSNTGSEHTHIFSSFLLIDFRWQNTK